MSRLLTGSINLSKIDKNKLYTSDKGEKFLNVSVWLNDEIDKYGNIAGIQQQTKKDENKIYIGNLKDYKKPEETTKVEEAKVVNNDSDGLPF